LLALCERSSMRPVIDSRYPLSAAPQAFDRLQSGAQFGKIALTIE
jgi:NADPH:quinone reductase-like Zn-dependent oxidoreductase